MRKLSLIILLAMALGGPAVADEWKQSYAVGSAPQLQLSVHDANIFVTGESTESIEIRITTDGIEIGEDGLVITESQSGDKVTLELKSARRGFWNWSYQAEVEVRVPLGTRLNLRTGDGNIDIRSLTAAAHLSTGDGNITVKDMEGNLTASTGDGDITTSDLVGDIQISTGDGNVEVAGRFAEVDIHTGDGQVELVAQQGSRVKAPWNVRTGDGSVTLRLPADLKADLDLDTGDGHIDLGLPVTVSGRADTRIRGALNGGGERVQVKTGDGSITLKPLT
ncbi:MAG: DUF4097 family beta strand repeat-containing protein [Acidobacteria bacterium]|nr:DUF4097 family beta strand repeat-containing protein [Acidobacteriota bacterium]